MVAHPGKEAFFARMSEEGLALTFDDVRLRTGPSEIPASEVSTITQFSKNIELKIPIVSAAMDTVTESEMAIALAKLGGLGVIHAGLSPEAQRTEVRRVKLDLNGLIERPISVHEDQTLEEVLAMCEERRFDFRTFPVINSEGKFVGLLTQNDFDFCNDKSQLVSSAMTPSVEITTAPGQVSVEEAHDQMRNSKKKTLPLLNPDGSVAGMYVFSDVNRIVGGNSEQYSLDDNGRLLVAAAIPTGPDAVERVGQMVDYLDVAVIDTAQGDSKFAIKTLTDLKSEFADLDVVIGNISEGISAKELANNGADGIKVGQGPGSICTTRTETGIGCPQVTAVYECVRAVAGRDVPICADGGIKDPGDLSIAIAAGAHSVMMGSVLAGTEETPGEIIVRPDSSRVKLYRGMGSPSALKESAAARMRYSDNGAEALAEGVESYVPYRGSVVDVIAHYVAALRKSMTYAGSKDITDHREKTNFWRITSSGLRESHPHDVTVLRP